MDFTLPCSSSGVTYRYSSESQPRNRPADVALIRDPRSISENSPVFDILDMSFYKSSLASLNNPSVNPLSELLSLSQLETSAENKTNKFQASVNHRNQTREKDLLKLLKMHGIIERFEEENSELSEALIEVGNLSGGENGLAYNQEDTESFWIRNKYGYIQRNNGKAKREIVIYFEQLYHLKILLKEITKNDCEKMITYNFQEDFKAKENLIKNDLLQLKNVLEFILKKEVSNIKTAEVFEKINSWNNQSINQIRTFKLAGIIDFSKCHYEKLTYSRIKSEILKFSSFDFNIHNLYDRYAFARSFTIICDLLIEVFEDRKKGNDKEQKCKIIGAKVFIDLRAILIKRHKKFIIGEGFLRMETLIASAIASIVEDTKESLNDEDLINSIKDNIDDMLNLESKLKNLLIESYDIINKSKSTLKRALKDKNKLYQEKYVRLKKHINNPSYPDVIDEDSIWGFKESIEKMKAESKFENDVNKKRLKKDKIEVLTLIADEIGFLMNVDKLDNITNMKKDYIVEHSATIIGQYARGLDAHDASKLIPTLSSRVIFEGRISAKAARNEGLGHNMFSLDRVIFKQRMNNDILPTYSNFKSLGFIYKHFQNSVPLSLITIFELAKAFFDLCCYPQAIQYANLFIELIEKTSRAGLKFEHFETGQELDSRILIIAGNKFLSEIYYIQGNYTESFRILDKISGDVEILDVNQSDQKILIICILTYKTTQLMMQGKYEEALKIGEKVASLDPNNFATKKDLMDIYRKLGQRNKLATLELYMEDNFEQLTAEEKYIYIVNKTEALFLRANKQTIEEIEENTKRLENMLNPAINLNYIKEFKGQFSDIYQIIQLKPIQFRVLIIGAKLKFSDEKQPFFDIQEFDQELKSLEKKFETSLKKIKLEHRTSAEISNVCKFFTIAFRERIAVSIEEADTLKNLLKAEEYLGKSFMNSYLNEDQIIAEYIATTYINTALRSKTLEQEMKIEYLEKALGILNKYDLEKSYALLNLGQLFFYKAARNLSLSLNKTSRKNAVLIYKKAILYLEKINPVCKNSLKFLALSHDAIGSIINNIEWRKKALQYYEEYQKFDPNDSKMISFRQQCHSAVVRAGLSML